MLTFTIDSAEAYCDLEIKDSSFDDLDIVEYLNAGRLTLAFEDGVGVIKTADTGIEVAYIKDLKLVAGADCYDFSTSFEDDEDDEDCCDDEWDDVDDWDDEGDWDEEDEEDV